MIQSSQNLFEQQMIVRHTDPRTSYVAAEKVVESGEIKTDHEKILAVLGKRPDYDNEHTGWTCAEICAEMKGADWRGIYHKFARRIGELVWLDKDKTVKGQVEIICQRISAIGGMTAQAYRKATI
jgi:hypothetical protein